MRVSSSKDILVNCCCRSFHCGCWFGVSSVRVFVLEWDDCVFVLSEFSLGAVLEWDDCVCSIAASSAAVFVLEWDDCVCLF